MSEDAVEAYVRAAAALTGLELDAESFKAVAANTRMREVMLPVLQFPVAFWILVLASDASSDALRGAEWPMVRAGIERVAGVSLVFTVASFLLFEYVLEE